MTFARLLREAGLSVASSEIAEAEFSVQSLGLAYPEPAHYDILQATLVKRREDQPPFCSLYKLYFGDANLTARSKSQRKTEPGGDQGFKSLGLSTLAAAMLNGDFTPCHNSIRDSVIKLVGRELPLEESVRRVLVNLDYFGALNSIRLNKERRKLPEWMYQNAVENAENLYREVQDEVLQRLLTLGADWQKTVRQLNWREKSFSLLTPAEMRLVKTYLDKIGKKLATKPGLKRKPAPGGEFDLGNTLRRAMATGGQIWKLNYAKRIPARPELVLLCDVSNSVYRFTGFMLQLVAAIKERFRSVRSFLFVDILWEVPADIFQADMQTALEDIRENNRCSVSGLSDFGQVFCQFAVGVLPEVSPQASLIILGDARNNWRPNEFDTFKQICQRFKHVYWLNPLSVSEWDEEDGQMHVYAPACSGVFECGNLAQLEQVVAKIL
ncbi:MAG TPA: VWA domain-containing protein [Desulfobacteria bacterium]|nr:VWA domain-containing protein [Desulfobacteria bacterium]